MTINCCSVWVLIEKPKIPPLQAIYFWWQVFHLNREHKMALFMEYTVLEPQDPATQLIRLGHLLPTRFFSGRA